MGRYIYRLNPVRVVVPGKNRIPTSERERLDRGWDKTCPLCKGVVESEIHLFLECPSLKVEQNDYVEDLKSIILLK